MENLSFPSLSNTVHIDVLIEASYHGLIDKKATLSIEMGTSDTVLRTKTMQNQPACPFVRLTVCTQLHPRYGSGKRVRIVNTDVSAHALSTFGASHTCSSLEEISLDQLLRGFSLTFRMQPRLFPGVLG